MNLTARLQAYIREKLTLEDALPTRLPVYLNSMAYLFGVLTLCSLSMLILSGVVLAFFGPDWYHISAAGRFFHSIHFWAAQLFFAFIMLHMTTKYFLGAFRDGRWKTWMIGALTFGVSIFSGFTGYLAASNWSAQWHAVSAKDAMNAMGIGAFFFTTNYSQMLTIHVAVLPIFIVLLVGIHLLFIRHEGPVKPYPAKNEEGPK
ncbi:MAG: cytochrome b N-terminal domain-containing protein [Rectinemataceae bacterium]